MCLILLRSDMLTSSKNVLCFAGILASAVLAANVVVSYQQKLADFLVDLASESGQPEEFVNKVE